MEKYYTIEKIEQVENINEKLEALRVYKEFSDEEKKLNIFFKYTDSGYIGSITPILNYRFGDNVIPDIAYKMTEIDKRASSEITVEDLIKWLNEAQYETVERYAEKKLEYLVKFDKYMKEPVRFSIFRFNEGDLKTISIFVDKTIFSSKLISEQVREYIVILEALKDLFRKYYDATNMNLVDCAEGNEIIEKVFREIYDEWKK